MPFSQRRRKVPATAARANVCLELPQERAHVCDRRLNLEYGRYSKFTPPFCLFLFFFFSTYFCGGTRQITPLPGCFPQFSWTFPPITSYRLTEPSPRPNPDPPWAKPDGEAAIGGVAQSQAWEKCYCEKSWKSRPKAFAVG